MQGRTIVPARVSVKTAIPAGPVARPGDGSIPLNRRCPNADIRTGLGRAPARLACRSGRPDNFVRLEIAAWRIGEFRPDSRCDERTRLLDPRADLDITFADVFAGPGGSSFGPRTSGVRCIAGACGSPCDRIVATCGCRQLPDRKGLVKWKVRKSTLTRRCDDVTIQTIAMEGYGERTRPMPAWPVPPHAFQETPDSFLSHGRTPQDAFPVSPGCCSALSAASD